MRARLQPCVWIAVWLAGCSYDLHKNPDSCTTNEECAPGFCHKNFCVSATGSTQGSAISSAKTGDPCDSGSDPVQCYEGDAETNGVGLCRPGMRFCAKSKYTSCLDQVKPAMEICNGLDDDCNGVDDDIAGQSCEVSGTVGGCGVAGAIVCRNGAPSCELTQLMGVESCNGKDDDCDGNTDENIAGTCFPASATGCEQDDNGLFVCHGVCVTGTASCIDGVPQCSGATTAGIEKCGGNPALDEDCDGLVDENCACTEGSSQNCYGGPVADGMSGRCGPGTQTCQSGKMGPCMSQDLPVPEDCLNPGKDDDCDGVKDDIKDLGAPCTDETAKGACRTGTLQCRPGSAAPVCVGAAPTAEVCDAIDQDCDGNPVNGFDLNSAQHCGACDATCAYFQTCCGGKCVLPISFYSDPLNCGGCGIACGSYQFCCEGHCYNPSWSSYNQPPPDANCCQTDCGAKTCCGAQCVDLQNDDYHCGSCGNECASDLWCEKGTCGMGMPGPGGPGGMP
jgi:stigma-specific protein Stig1/putative metal-binding protein